MKDQFRSVATAPEKETRRKTTMRSRAVELATDSTDSESRLIRATVSSDEPVLTYIWDNESDWFVRAYEILDHKKTSVRLDRMKAGGPVLVNHDRDKHVGVTESIEIKDNRATAVGRFGRSALAEETLRDVVDGIKRFTSIHYRVHEYKREKNKLNGFPVYRAVDWEMFEWSVVSVPADITVGVQRDAGAETFETLFREDEEEGETMFRESKRDAAGATAPAETAPSSSGSNGDAAAVANAANDARRSERERQAQIAAVRTRWPELSAFCDEASRSEMTVEQFNREVVAKLRETNQVQPHTETAADVGLSRRERRQFSFVRLFRALADQHIPQLQEEAAFELEACRAASALQPIRKGMAGSGFALPSEVLREPFVIPMGTPIPRSWRTWRPDGATPPQMQRAFQVADNDQGGFLVQTDLLTASFIELMTARIVMAPRATTLTGLQGHVAIPKEVGEQAVVWLAEDGTAPDNSTENMFGQVSMTPKTAASRAGITRRMLLQSSIGIEAWLRMHLAGVRAREIERVIIAGSGAGGQPTGLQFLSGVGTVTTGGAALSWAHIVEFWTDVANANGDFGDLAYITNALVAGTMLIKEKATGTAQFLMSENRKALTYDVMISTKVPANIAGSPLRSMMAFGNWSELLLGYWSGIDVNVDPFTQAAKGQLIITTMQDMDVAWRHPESFSRCVDINPAA